MKGLAIEQRKILAEFCTNFAVAWLAAGIIAPYVSGKSFVDLGQPTFSSIFWGIIFLIIAVGLMKNVRKI